jgi:hypothetical protein
VVGFYDEMADVATELLTEFNQGVITLAKTTTAPPDDPWTPGSPTTTTYTLQATAKGVSKEFIDGTTIVATDIEITPAAYGADPDPADVLSNRRQGSDAVEGHPRAGGRDAGGVEAGGERVALGPPEHTSA